jgi:PAS domain S-box-containing protein
LLARFPPLDTFLHETARLATAALGVPAAIIFERTTARAGVRIRTSHGWQASPTELNGASSLAHHATAVLSGRARGAARIDTDLASGQPASLHPQALHTAAGVVIGGGDAAFGVLAVYAHDEGTLSDQAFQTLEVLAALAGVAVELARQDQQLNRERDERFHLASLIEGSDDAIVSATLDGVVLTWNPGAERLYGYAAGEVVGRDVSVLIPEERDADRRLLLERVRAGQRIPAFDATHRRKDGSPVTVSLSLSPVKDGHGRVVAVAGIAHDVTQTRRLESELGLASKMETVGRLAGGLAHDFNNILTVIDGYSELALIKLPADDPLRELIDEIHKAGERASGLTRQLMVFSRKSMVEPAVLHLPEVVGGQIDRLARVAGADVRLVTRFEQGVAHVMADRSLLEQVLVALVLNAREAMPRGGEVSIATADVQISTARDATPREIPPGQYVELSIRDTGVGMDQATRARLFEPFFTTRGSGRGTGLGLAMLQQFAMQSGGFVTVESERGQGTCVHIFLPTVPLPAAPSAAEPGADAPAGSETVLVVEDDEAVRQFTRAVLMAAGYQVLSAADGNEALTLARSHTGPVHLLITDVVIPVLDGHALADQFHALHPNGRILFTSGYTPEAVSRRGITIPASQFIQKPYAPASLCRHVRTALD